MEFKEAYNKGRKEAYEEIENWFEEEMNKIREDKKPNDCEVLVRLLSILYNFKDKLIKMKHDSM